MNRTWQLKLSNTIIIILLYMCYAFWIDFPRSIIRPGFFEIRPYNVLNGVIIHLIIVFFLGCIVSSWVIDRKTFRVMRNILLPMLLVDCVATLLREMLDPYAYFISDIFIALSWMVVYAVLNRNDRKRNVYVIFTILTGLAIVIDIYLFAIEMSYLGKLNASSDYYIAVVNNNMFYAGVKSGLIDMALCCITIIQCSYLYDSSNRETLTTRDKTGAILRPILVAVGLALITIVEMQILPHQKLLSIDTSTVTRARTMRTGIELRMEERETTVYRVLDFEEGYLAFGEKEYVFTVDGDKVSSFKTPIIRKDGEYPIISTDDYVLVGNMIIIVSGDGVKAYDIKKLPTEGVNEELVVALAAQVLGGNWNVYFESAEYLLQQGVVGIQDTIKRYANGDFTYEELEYNSDIIPEYIIRKSRELIEEYGL